MMLIRRVLLLVEWRRIIHKFFLIGSTDFYEKACLLGAARSIDTIGFSLARGLVENRKWHAIQHRWTRFRPLWDHPREMAKNHKRMQLGATN